MKVSLHALLALAEANGAVVNRTLSEARRVGICFDPDSEGNGEQQFWNVADQSERNRLIERLADFLGMWHESRLERRFKSQERGSTEWRGVESQPGHAESYLIRAGALARQHPNMEFRVSVRIAGSVETNWEPVDDRR